MSGVIGGGAFFNDGAALAYAGPLGVIISVVVVSIVAICFMECLTELVQLFPAPTAIYHYIKTFLDPELAWVASIGYWCVVLILSRKTKLIGERVAGTPMQSPFRCRHPLLPVRRSHDGAGEGIESRLTCFSDNSKYWDMPATLRSILYYFLIPFVLLIMNLLPVYVSLAL